MKRKTLKLIIAENGDVFAIDPKDSTNTAVLLQSDFRDSVISAIKSGKFCDGELFEVDVDNDGNFIRRDFDGTIKVHKPFPKVYSPKKVREICQECIDLLQSGVTPDLEQLVPNI